MSLKDHPDQEEFVKNHLNNSPVGNHPHLTARDYEMMAGCM
ncbi:hypothetical protein FB545_1172 [Peribacillus frigoritolerans]|nr:hypothetical protein FB545_1172 [Peribacillus frigoritolerans]